MYLKYIQICSNAITNLNEISGLKTMSSTDSIVVSSQFSQAQQYLKESPDFNNLDNLKIWFKHQAQIANFQIDSLILEEDFQKSFIHFLFE